MKSIYYLFLLMPIMAIGQSQQPPWGTYTTGEYVYLKPDASQSDPLTTYMGGLSTVYSSDVKVIYVADFIKLLPGFKAGPFSEIGNFRTSSTLRCTLQIQNVTCYGGSNGSAVVTASGGTPPYTYSWSGGGNTNQIINKISGVYNCTITDSRGLSIVKQAIINQPNEITFDYTNVFYSCSNASKGMIFIEILGGVIPYTITPDPNYNSGFYEAIPGNYSLTVKDANNCSKVGNFHISNYKIKTVTLSRINTNYKIVSVMTDDNTNFTVLGTNDFWTSNYNSWDTRNSWTVNYRKFENCDDPPVENEDYLSLNVEVNDYISYTCMSSIKTITVEDPDSFCDAFSGAPAISKPTAITKVKSYEETLLDSNESEFFNGNSHIAVSPNPSNGSMIVDYSLKENENGFFDVYSLIGEKVASFLLLPGNNQLTISDINLSNGLYIYKVYIRGNLISSDKIIIIR